MASVALLSNPRSTGNRALLPRVREYCAAHPDIFHYEVERDQIGLAAGQDRDRRRAVGKIAAIVKLGQRRLDGAVAAIDHQHLGIDEGDRLERGSDLIDMLHLIVEDVLMLGAEIPDAREKRAIARRAGIGKKRDPGHGQRLTGPIDRPFR